MSAILIRTLNENKDVSLSNEIIAIESQENFLKRHTNRLRKQSINLIALVKSKVQTTSFEHFRLGNLIKHWKL